jgi:hypothetical protein
VIHHKTFFIITAVAVVLSCATRAVQAQITEQVAKKCRELMIKAHPTQMYGASGAAADQRTFFLDCVKRESASEGNAAPDTTGTTTTNKGRPKPRGQ